MLAIFLVASFDSISEIVRVRKLEFEAKVQFLSCDLGWFCWCWEVECDGSCFLHGPERKENHLRPHQGRHGGAEPLTSGQDQV